MINAVLAENTVGFDVVCKVIELLGSTMNDYLYVYDFQNDVYVISPQAEKRFCIPGCRFNNVLEAHRSFVYPEDYPALCEELIELKSSKRTIHNQTYRWLSIEEKPIWINCRGRVVRSGGKALYMVGCINEIGNDQQTADNRSGLLGTTSLKKYIQMELPISEGGFLMRIGLDDLKGINARLGVEYGEQILIMVSAFITKNCASAQKVFKLDGDEFFVIDTDGGTVDDAKMLYRNIRSDIERFIAENHYKAFFTVSAGIVDCADLPDASFSTVMKLTEYALDEARDSGKNQFCVYTDEGYEKFLKRRKLNLLLRSSVENNFEGFELYLQPVFGVEKGKIIGAEALMRFKTEEYGMISPMEFIPFLEETGLIIPAGKWMMRRAFAACKSLKELVPDFHISVNVSAVQLIKSSFAKELMRIIDEVGINPSDITCELTESEELEADRRFGYTAKRLKESGVLLALDDFGSGYSNFRYLVDLMPDKIKVDRIFTTKAVKNEFEYKLLSMFSEMAHALNIKIVLEGVENEDELKVARQISADYIQGYYYGKPCPYEEFVKLLA